MNSASAAAVCGLRRYKNVICFAFILTTVEQLQQRSGEDA